jgi:DNA-binding NarL/FixJ family response regulator
MQVLIVDRAIGVIERLEEIIAEAKHITAIHKAVSYEEAKKLVDETRYDAILLDIDLPGNDSLKLLKEIRKISEKTFVVIMFTHVDSYIMKQCRSIGVDFIFDKYYDFEKIRELLAAYHK